MLKNINILSFLINDFKKVIISQITLDELNYQKDKKKNNTAWLVMQKINELKDKIERYDDRKFEGSKHDEKIRAMATHYSKEKNIPVFVLHDDIGFSLNYENSLLLREYIGIRQQGIYNPYLDELKEKYVENWEKEIIQDSIDYNSWLPDGNTLLIDCIRSKNKFKKQKLIFLLERCHVNVDKTDCGKYFLTPLSHCIQVNDLDSFCILLQHGADYNKGSINETHIDYIRLKNEGNTPLMIACWHDRRDFVKKLCSFEDIGLNQQDSNGFTPLMKCVCKENKNKDLYRYLLKFPRTDIHIRDRNNHTAEWWLTHEPKESNGR